MATWRTIRAVMVVVFAGYFFFAQWLCRIFLRSRNPLLEFFPQISLVYHLEIKNNFNKNIAVLCEYRIILLNLWNNISQSVIVKAEQKTMKFSVCTIPIIFWYSLITMNFKFESKYHSGIICALVTSYMQSLLHLPDTASLRLHLLHKRESLAQWKLSWII